RLSALRTRLSNDHKSDLASGEDKGGSPKGYPHHAYPMMESSLGSSRDRNTKLVIYRPVDRLSDIFPALSRQERQAFSWKFLHHRLSFYEIKFKLKYKNLSSEASM